MKRPECLYSIRIAFDAPIRLTSTAIGIPVLSENVLVNEYMCVYVSAMVIIM